MRESGFTVIELLIGMAIVAVLAAMAFPAMERWIENARLTSTTNALVEAFMTARSEAIRRGQAVQVIPGDGAVGFRVVLASNPEEIIRSFDNEAPDSVVIKFVPDIEFVEYRSNGSRAADGVEAVDVYICNQKGDRGRRLSLSVAGSTKVEQLEGGCS